MYHNMKMSITPNVTNVLNPNFFTDHSKTFRGSSNASLKGEVLNNQNRHSKKELKLLYHYIIKLLTITLNNKLIFL